MRHFSEAALSDCGMSSRETTGVRFLRPKVATETRETKWIKSRIKSTIKTNPGLRCVLLMETMADELDLGRLYDVHAQALFSYLLNFTRNEQDTRDGLQEVFTKLARNPKALRDARDERAFLIRLAHNAAIDSMRRRGTRERHHERYGMEHASPFAPSADPDEAAFRAELSAGLGELPPEQREVVHLKLWEGLTFEQIAAALEIPANTAASRYRYGIDKLRELLRPLYEEIK
jgi:RNA polymerase sigma-70 factor, ECF subfamily